LPSLLLPVVWLPFGMLHLRPAGHFVVRRATWIAGTAAAIGLEVAAVTGIGVPSLAETYVGAPVVSWVQLAEAAGFLVIGLALVASVTVRFRKAV
jgi:hypothetical protein